MKYKYCPQCGSVLGLKEIGDEGLEIFTPWFKADVGELTSLKVWEFDRSREHDVTQEELTIS